VIQFNLNGEYIELYKLLKATGLSETGGQAGQLIGQGLVKVDGDIERRKGRKIHRGQKVEFRGEVIDIR